MGNERTNEAIARADDALYEAKHSGRNKVIVSYFPICKEPELA